MDEGTLRQVRIWIILLVLYSPSLNGIANQWYLGDVMQFRALSVIPGRGNGDICVSAESQPDSDKQGEDFI